MWQHVYTPVGGSLSLSALAAVLPVAALLIVLAGLRKASWIASLAGLATAAVVAIWVYGMPVSLAASAVAYGAAQGLFPIGWVVFSAILLYNITVATGQFDTVRASVGNLTADRRLQALLIAFAFGAFIEGAAGFGTPVAVAAAMLTGLGFKPFRAATICLLANTAPVAFGSIGTLSLNHAAPNRHRPPFVATECWCWPHLRSGLSVHSRLSGTCHGRLEGVARRSASRFALRNFIRCGAVPGIELHWRRTNRYPRIPYRCGLPGHPVASLGPEG